MEGGRRPRRALFGGARSSRTPLIGIGIVVASAAGYGCSGSDSDGVERTTTTTTVSAEQQEIFDRSAQIVEAWIGCLETTRSMMDEMLADPDSSVYVVIRNYGSESPVFRPMVDAYAETSRAWFTGGERGAGEVFFGLQTELCDQPWFVNEINHASVGSSLYWDPEYGLDGQRLTASGSDRSAVTADELAEMEEAGRVAAELEVSSPADNQYHVAIQVMNAWLNGDSDEFTRWAELSLPTDPPEVVHLETLVCDVQAMECHLDIDEDSFVRLSMDYGDRGWWLTDLRAWLRPGAEDVDRVEGPGHDDVVAEVLTTIIQRDQSTWQTLTGEADLTFPEWTVASFDPSSIDCEIFGVTIAVASCTVIADGSSEIRVELAGDDWRLVGLERD